MITDTQEPASLENLDSHLFSVESDQEESFLTKDASELETPDFEDTQGEEALFSVPSSDSPNTEEVEENLQPGTGATPQASEVEENDFLLEESQESVKETVSEVQPPTQVQRKTTKSENRLPLPPMQGVSSEESKRNKQLFLALQHKREGLLFAIEYEAESTEEKIEIQEEVKKLNVILDWLKTLTKQGIPYGDNRVRKEFVDEVKSTLSELIIHDATNAVEIRESTLRSVEQYSKLINAIRNLDNLALR